MNQKKHIHAWLKPAMLSFGLAAWCGLAQGQTFTNVIFNQFDDEATSISLVKWWGDPSVTLAWDGTVSTPPGPRGTNAASSGSLKMTVDWTNTHNQLMMWQEIDGAQTWWVNPENRVNGFYYDLSFDIKFDPSSSMGVNGGRGNLRFGVTTPAWVQRELAAFNPFPVTNDWTHVDCKIPANLVDIDQITGWYMYYNWQPGNITNQQIVWIDNIILYTNLNKDLKPPTLSMAPIKGSPGLQFIAGPAQYDRQMIRTIATNVDYTWYNQPQPVSYAMTVTDYPVAPHTNFQAHILLIPNPGTETAPDWNQPHTIALMVENRTDGTAFGNFRYKTNQPGANSMMYNSEPTNGPVGYLTALDAPTGNGTWALTFANNTNVTVSGPGGVSTNITLPDDAVAYFASGVKAYFGNQPNRTNNPGEFNTITRVKISGLGAANVDDTFPGPGLNQDTNAPVWEKIAANASAITVVGTNDVFNLWWTLPDLNFVKLEVSPNPTGGPWTDTALVPRAVVKGATRAVIVPKTVLPSTTQNYFRMSKRLATKLQVLLPGETAAPGTPTGKTGTPNPWITTYADNVTIRAVDNNWDLATACNDTVSISSTDTTATTGNSTPLPVNVTLSGGQATVSIIFMTGGNWTITATDVTDPSKTAGTSSTVEAQ